MRDFLKKKYNYYLPLVDILTIVGSYLLAIFFTGDRIEYFPLICIINVLLYLSLFYIFHFYKTIWVHASTSEFIKALFVCLAGGILSYFISLVILPIFSLPAHGLRAGALATIFITAIFILLRLGLKTYVIVSTIKKSVSKPDSERKNVLIVGAGSAAEICIYEMQKSGKYNIVGLIDDATEKKHAYLSGIKVLGTRHEIKDIAASCNITEILIAIPTLSAEQRSEIIDICEPTGCEIKILPYLQNIITSGSLLNSARNVEIEDLLCRESVELDNTKIDEYIKGQTVLVTGGGGSIGSELCRQLVAFHPKKLIILDNYENTAYELYLELKRHSPKANVQVIIATVRDKLALQHIFSEIKPDVIFHAAAHKHVPLMEVVPKEAVKNNVFGTLNTALCAIECGVKKFVMISTDKAVNPTNIMGATKRLCEIIIQTLNSQSDTEFVAVRFGNVLGSHGSVVPIFKQQIEEGGPVTLTHKDITRFFMTIPEAAQLVLQAGAYAKNGEIFVLDMGQPVKIYDLAEKLITLMGYKPNVDIKINVTGLRPGEKLYEELMLSEEGITQTSHKKIFIAKPLKYNPDSLYSKLHHFSERIDEMSDDEVKHTVLDLVPTYHPQAEKVSATVAEKAFRKERVIV